MTKKKRENLGVALEVRGEVRVGHNVGGPLPAAGKGVRLAAGGGGA